MPNTQQSDPNVRERQTYRNRLDTSIVPAIRAAIAHNLGPAQFENLRRRASEARALWAAANAKCPSPIAAAGVTDPAVDIVEHVRSTTTEEGTPVKERASAPRATGGRVVVKRATLEGTQSALNSMLHAYLNLAPAEHVASLQTYLAGYVLTPRPLSEQAVAARARVASLAEKLGPDDELVAQFDADYAASISDYRDPVAPVWAPPTVATPEPSTVDKSEQADELDKDAGGDASSLASEEVEAEHRTELARIAALEAEGLTTSDAQAVEEAEAAANLAAIDAEIKAPKRTKKEAVAA